jgi:transcriptional regulator with PAS, ATPase and Fis domain
MELAIPSLRSRREEVMAILRDTLETHLDGACPEPQPEFVEALLLYDWPFNVRELVQLGHRLAVLHGSESELRLDHLPERITSGRAVPEDRPSVVARLLERRPSNDQILDALVLALRTHRGNVSRAAAQVGISRQKAYRLMKAASEDAASEDEAQPAPTSAPSEE